MRGKNVKQMLMALDSFSMRAGVAMAALRSGRLISAAKAGSGIFLLMTLLL